MQEEASWRCDPQCAIHLRVLQVNQQATHLLQPVSSLLLATIDGLDHCARLVQAGPTEGVSAETIEVLRALLPL